MADDKKDAKEEKKAPKVADWQKPDYNGALDAVQATWRNKNIKPAKQNRTK